MIKQSGMRGRRGNKIEIKQTDRQAEDEQNFILYSFFFLENVFSFLHYYSKTEKEILKTSANFFLGF